MAWEVITPASRPEKKRLKPLEQERARTRATLKSHPGKFERRLVGRFKRSTNEQRRRTEPLDTQLVQGLKRQTPREKALEFATLGHVGGPGGFEREIGFSPQGKMIRRPETPTAEIPITESPILAGATAATAALRAPGTVAARLGRGAAEAVSEFTGGISNIPGYMKQGQRLIPRLPSSGAPGRSRLRPPIDISPATSRPAARRTLKALPAPAEPKMVKWPGEFFMQEQMVQEYPELAKFQGSLKAGQDIDLNNLHRLNVSAQDIQHKMPDGTTMSGPEHPGAVQGSEEIKRAPKRKRTGGSKVETIRGRIQQLGGVDFGHFKGELKDMPVGVKRSIVNKSGMHVTDVERVLKDENYMLENEDLMELLRTDANETMRRRHGSIDILERDRNLTAREQQIKDEMEFEPEEPEEFRLQREAYERGEPVPVPDDGEPVVGLDGEVIPFGLAIGAAAASRLLPDPKTMGPTGRR